jgi:hypothetical protein
MLFTSRPAVARSYVGTAALCLFAIAAAGCSHQQTEEQAAEAFFKNNPTAAKPIPVAKFAGRVTIDGQPPGADSHLFVILNDPEHLEKPGKAGPRLFATCDAEGNFAFKTHVAGDGVPYGKYVVTFVQLHRYSQTKARHFGGTIASFGEQYVGPDALKNLYNDPEKNKADQAFQVDVEPPGRTEYSFNLSIAGKETVAQPGQYSVTNLKG